MCNLSLCVANLMDIAEKIITAIVISPFLPLFCAVIFYLSEYSLFILAQLVTLKLMDQFHCITASYPTQISKIFHFVITFMIGLNGWMYHLYDYICLFVLIFLIIISFWILALSNLYPFNSKKHNKTENQKDSNNQSMNPFHSQMDTSSFNSSFNLSQSLNNTNDSYFYSPIKSKETKQSETANLSFSTSLPFELKNKTLLFDDDDNDHLNGTNFGKLQSVNGSIINFNKLTSATLNFDDVEASKMRILSEPTNFFQGIVGFSAVHCCLNYLNIFDAQRKKSIIDTMTKQNYFNLSSLHFSSMIIDLFSFILIPFFLFHIFLLYQSQHSLSFCKKSLHLLCCVVLRVI